MEASQERAALTHARSKIKIWKMIVQHRFVLVMLAMVAAAAGMVMMDYRQGEDALLELRESTMTQKASGNVVVVSIDNKTLDKIQYPLPRANHAKVIANLMNAGAQKVALDLDFSRQAQPENDGPFLAAVREYPGQIYAIKFDGYDTPGYDGIWGFTALQNALGTNAAPAGVITKEGRVRSLTMTWPVTYNGMDHEEPTLWARLADRQGTGAFELNSRIDPATVPQISYIDILENRFPEEAVSGKTIIIGPTAEILQDQWRILRSDNTEVPGSVIQAMAIDTLKGNAINKQDALLPAICMLLIVALSTLLSTEVRRVMAMVAGAALLAGVVIVLESTQNLRYDVLPALAGLVSAILATTGIAAIRQNYNAATLNHQTGIANEVAMLQEKLGPQQTVVVARMDSLVGIQRAVGLENMGTILRMIRDRVNSANQHKIYQIETTHFAWIMEDDTTIIDHVEGITRILMQGIRYEDRLYDMNVVIGLPESGCNDIATCLDQAIQACENATNRNARLQRFDPKSKVGAEWRASMLGELDRGIDNGQVSNAYQPKYDIAKDKITGFEALVRWDHPNQGRLSPDSFIGVAEAAGRIDKLTWFVIERALSDIAELRTNTGEDYGIAVNLSAKMVGNDKKLAERIGRLLKKTGMPANKVTLEVTETSVISHIDSAMSELRQLKAMGLRISIDDFGTGQSSMAYIRDLDADEIKIDQSYIKNIHNTLHHNLVSYSIDMARSLGKRVIAEGVETPDVLEVLKKLRCDEIQGYLIGRPVSYKDLIQFLRQRKAA